MLIGSLLNVRLLLLVPLIIIMVIGAACGGGDDTPSSSRLDKAESYAYTPTPAPTATLVPTPEPKGTNTPLPPPTAIPTPVPAPTVGYVTSGTKRLVVASGVPIHETLVPWRSSSQIFLQRPMYEHLLSTDRVTGYYQPQLAKSWDVSADAKAWTMHLVEGVQFHKNKGEFTAKDVVHTWQRIVDDGGTMATDRSQWTELIAGADTFDIPDDHTIVLNLTRPVPELTFRLSTRSGNMLVTSAAHFTADGADKMEEDPAGTGAYQYVGRAQGEAIHYERVENHWRHTPEFQEMTIRIAREAATRMAMMLTGEAHITDLPTDLRRQAVGAGLATKSSSLYGSNYFYFFGTNFPGLGLGSEYPWSDVKVRHAMNIAIDRETLIDTIFDGAALAAPLMYHSPAEPGWDDSWTTRWEEYYGYNPEKAKALLAEAGYPNGFEFKLYNYNIASFSEGSQVGEALAGYFADIGLTVDLVDTEYNIPRGAHRVKELDGLMYWWPFSARPPAVGLGSTWSCAGAFVVYCHEDTELMYKQLLQSSSAEERAKLAIEIGEHHFSQYAGLWMFHPYPTVVLNPAIVEDYKFPGNWTDLYTHLEYVEAA